MILKHIDKFQILFIVLVLGLGCDSQLQFSPEPASIGKIVIQAILIESEKEQKILITRTRNPINNGVIETVDDAYVTVNNVRFQWKHKIEVWDPYNYYTNDLHIKPLQEYKLLVIAEGDTFMGRTVVPDTLVITSKSDTIFWNKAKNACLYQLSGKCLGEYSEYLDNYLTTDTCYSVPINSSKAIDSFYEIEIQAFDNNYYQYTKKEEDRIGLEGNVYGFFGSMTLSRKTVFLSKCN